MSKKAQLLCSSFLAATCIAMLFQLGQAQLPMPPPVTLPLPPPLTLPLPPPVGLTPGLPQPGLNMTNCLSSLMHIPGCLVGLYASSLTGQFWKIGPTCCKAYLATDGNCTSKLFPSNPLFTLLLKSYCAQFSPTSPGNSSPPPAPSGNSSPPPVPSSSPPPVPSSSPPPVPSGNSSPPPVPSSSPPPPPVPSSSPPPAPPGSGQ